MATLTETQLIEKIVRARVVLENGRKPHTEECKFEDSPRVFRSCTCGAYYDNKPVNDALKILEL